MTLSDCNRRPWPGSPLFSHVRYSGMPAGVFRPSPCRDSGPPYRRRRRNRTPVSTCWTVFCSCAAVGAAPMWSRLAVTVCLWYQQAVTVCLWFQQAVTVSSLVSAGGNGLALVSAGADGLSVVSAGSPARRSTHTRRIRCHTAVHQGRRHHGNHHAHLHGRHRRLLRLHHPEGEADGGGGVGSVCSVLITVTARRFRWERVPCCVMMLKLIIVMSVY